MTPAKIVRPTGPSRPQLAIAVCLLLTAGAAWWSTAARMEGMDAGPGTLLGPVGSFLGLWTVMMAAMMLPSLAPAAAYASLGSRGGRSSWLLFTAGYLLVWSAAGAAAYVVFELGRDVLGGAFAWHTGGRWLSATVLALAAGYQVTPMKRACLRMCRSPWQRRSGRGFSGWRGALTAGASSGRWCVGSSWALMAALFALGVMSLTWMVLVAALVACEKLAPSPRTATVAAAAVLVALAGAMATVPDAIPGLAIPDSHHAMLAMGSR